MLKLEFLMIERGVSDEQLAVAADCKARTIENYRKGNTAPDVHTAAKIAEFFGDTDAPSIFQEYVPIPIKEAA